MLVMVDVDVDNVIDVELIVVRIYLFGNFC